MSSKSKARLPAEPLISIRMAFLRPSANRVASKVPRAPPENRPRNTAASSTVTVPVSVATDAAELAAGDGQRPLLDERLEQRADAGEGLPGDVLRQVDDVRADVAERTGAGLVLLQPPRHGRGRVGDPVLQVLGAHVPDVAEPAVGDELAGQRDRRHPAVGEADHRPHAVGGGLGGGLGHRLGLGDGVGQRLLAQHVLAGLERGDRDLGVGVTGRADVDQVDVVALDHAAPVGLGARPAQPLRRRR